MQHATPDALLRAWELGMADSRPSARSRALLGAAGVAGSPDEWGALSIGRCEGLLLDLRERLFGSRFEAWVACPRCGQGLELEFDATDLKAPLVAGEGQPLAVCVGDYSVTCQAPCVDDLAGVERLPSSEQQRAHLLGRVVLEASLGGHPCAAADLPQAVVDEIERTLEERDARVLTGLGVNCEACGHRWSAPFDMVAYLWTELERWAVRLLWEVSALAQAYGWSEIDLITMTPWRRQRYLEMLGT
ncbi:MAG TPA: hypothetical protein VKG63_07440 [Steroidobacteraceae bacterium]|nr:hypothetical protein [Steroidobacteraceae bacterium]